LLIRTLNEHQLREGIKVKAMNAKNHPKPVKTAVRTADKQTEDA
jgi:hypothetical protein